MKQTDLYWSGIFLRNEFLLRIKWIWYSRLSSYRVEISISIDNNNGVHKTPKFKNSQIPLSKTHVITAPSNPVVDVCSRSVQKWKGPKCPISATNNTQHLQTENDSIQSDRCMCLWFGKVIHQICILRMNQSFACWCCHQVMRQWMYIITKLTRLRTKMVYSICNYSLVHNANSLMLPLFHSW